MAENSLADSLSTTRTKSSGSVPIMLAITGIDTSFKFENSLAVSSAPGFEYPTAFNMPPSKGITVGFLCPSLASKLTDLIVAAPTPLTATRSSRDLDVPRNPDGRTVGFDIFIPHRTVLRFGVVIIFRQDLQNK